MTQDGTYIIGRTAASGGRRRNRLVLDHPTVSHRHAELLVLAETYYLTDLGSRNGIWRERRGRVERLSEGYVRTDERLWFGQCETTLAQLLGDSVAA